MQYKTRQPLFAKLDEPTSGASAAISPNITPDLLKAADLGLKMTGIILACEEPRLNEGIGKGGKPFSMTQRRLSVWTGNRSVDVSETLPKGVNGQAPPQFVPVHVGQKLALTVRSLRVYNETIGYDVAVEPS